METKPTNRGFEHGRFTDRYGEECSIQESSLATEAAIWLGISAPRVMYLAPDKGWVEIPQHPDTHINGRMHLTQDMVRDLLPLLQRFAETGELNERHE